jgi:hypothetical protein
MGMSSYDRWATQTPEEYFGLPDDDTCDYLCGECGCCKISELNDIDYARCISHIPNLGEAKWLSK